MVQNDKPIIGQYGLNREGSGDMYYKAGNMLHTMRHILSNDEKWRQILRGLNKDFWHQIVTTQQIEAYISKNSGIDFSKFFDQYLRDTRIPRLNYEIDGKKLTYWFTEIVDSFSFSTRIRINKVEQTVTPTAKKQSLEFDSEIDEVYLDRNFYFEIHRKDSTPAETSAGHN